MADNLTDEAEALVLDWVNGVGAPTRPTTPLKLALTTTVGTDSAGGTEVTGGSYTRQDVVISAAPSPSNSGAVTYLTMPLTDVLGVEVWNNGGTVRIWYGGLTGPAFTVTAADDTFTAASHGMADNTKVAFAPGQAPAGATANTVYFVRDTAANTFKIAATAGGSAINITADGSGTAIKVKSVNAGDTFVINSGELDMTLG